MSNISKTTRENLISGKKPFNLKKWWIKNWQFLAMVAVPLLFILLFYYGPMYGLQIAFKKYRAIDGIWGSKWIGFENFTRFFKSYQFEIVLRNTVIISLYSLLAGFPVPILLAIALNSAHNLRFKKIVQMVTYAPNFISTVVMVGIIIQVLSPKYGVINTIIKIFGGKEILFMATAKYFSTIFVVSGVWQTMGWNAIIYISALSSVSPALHEAAIIDGASRFKRTLHIDIPGIMPTIIILLILSVGRIMNVSFEKIYLMQNATNLENSEVISTLIYKIGLQASIPNYSYSTAIGLFNNVINLILLVSVNTLAKKWGGTSLW